MKKLTKILDHPVVRTFEISSSLVGIVSYAGSFVDQSVIPNIINVSKLMIQVLIILHMVSLIAVLSSQWNDWGAWKKFDPNVKVSHVFLPRLTMGVLWSFLGRNFIALFMLSLLYFFPEIFPQGTDENINPIGATIMCIAALIVLSWYATSFRNVGET